MHIIAIVFSVCLIVLLLKALSDSERQSQIASVEVAAVTQTNRVIFLHAWRVRTGRIIRKRGNRAHVRTVLNGQPRVVHRKMHQLRIQMRGEAQA